MDLTCSKTNFMEKLSQAQIYICLRVFTVKKKKQHCFKAYVPYASGTFEKIVNLTRTPVSCALSTLGNVIRKVFFAYSFSRKLPESTKA